MDIYLEKQKKPKTNYSEIESPGKVIQLESEVGSDQCIENSAISTDSSEDSDVFHDSNHDPFDSESEEDN